MKRAFRPPVWAWFVTGAIIALLVSMGAWQVRRAQEKENRLLSYVSATAAAPMTLTRNSRVPSPATVMAAVADGAYLPDRQLLLDNQSHGGHPGYRVWTPLRLASGGTIVVDRGWVPADPRRTILPDVAVSAEPRSLRGLWRDLPRPGLKFASAHVGAASFPAVVEYPTATELQRVLGEPVAPGVLLLDPAEKDGFTREWNPATDFPPSRHYAYAAQWFALAVTLLILFIRINLKGAK